MSKTKKKPPFDALTEAVRVRQGQAKLVDFSIEEQMEIRRKLAHTGRLRTELLRREVGRTTNPRDTGMLSRTSHHGGFFS